MGGVVFDFNGTMFFDEEFQNISWRSFLEEKTGKTVTDEEFQEFVHGRNNQFTLAHFISPDLTAEEMEKLAEEKEQKYRNLCLESSCFRLEEGLPEFLDQLKKQGIPMTNYGVAIACMKGILKRSISMFPHLAEKL